MTLELQAYCCLCALEKFIINGIPAEYEDFGDKEDLEPYNAPDYGCGNMQFIPRLPSQETLNKYHISIDEYNEICKELQENLSFGCCAWCS